MIPMHAGHPLELVQPSDSLAHGTHTGFITAVARMVSILLGCTSQYSLANNELPLSSWHPHTCHCKMPWKTSPTQSL